MGFLNILAAIDGSLGSDATDAAIQVVARPSPKPRHIGRRIMLGGAASGLAIAGLSMFSETSLGRTLDRPAARSAAQTGHSVAVSAPTAPELPTTLSGMDHVRVPPSAAESRDYAAFRARFIQPDGRVIDTFNHGESHTESQGTGMLLAVAFNDRECFDRIWNWTERNLSRGSDALHAWRYIPGTANPVADQNNATDGDIYIAGALVRASSLWGSVAYLRSGQAIARDILTLLVRDVGGRVVLLPGADGFATASHVDINASYYIFPLLTELQQAYPSPTWQRLLDDGRRLIADARFGRWQLPPDWLSVSTRDGSLSLAQRQPPRFSFDAVRIPLFVAWDRGGPAALQSFAGFWGQQPAQAPAWVDLTTNVCAPYKTCGGVVAIARFADHATRVSGQAGLPAIVESDEYYSAALILLSRLAMRETSSRIG